jgi:DNA-binding CsgD family transcriptional regulator
MTDEEIARCPIHQEYYRKWPECWNTLLCPMEEDDTLVVPAVQRGAVHQDFDDSERAVLGLISPHIGRVTRLKQLLPSGGIQKDDLVAGLDAFDEAIILLDARGIVRFMNGRAAEMAVRKDGFSVHRGVLVAGDRDCRDALDRLIAKSLHLALMNSLEAPEPVVLRRPNARKPLLLSAFVVPDSGTGRVSVLIRGREMSPPRVPKIEAIQTALGLTVTEARLALAIAQGASLSEHAERVGISEHTARAHMRNIREKLKVRRQADVIRRVMEIGGG